MEESSRDRLVTLVMKRKYEKSGKTLPVKYWNLPEFKSEYQHQMRGAAKLTKAFSFEAINKALENERWCWSLHNPGLVEKIQLAQSEIDSKKIALNEIQSQLPEQSEKQIENKPLFRKKQSGKKEK